MAENRHEIAGFLPAANIQAEQHSPPNLTARETEVLKLIADGKSTSEIAHLLQIRFKTAACHRYKILGKFGVHESVSVVRRAIRLGIIEA